MLRSRLVLAVVIVWLFAGTSPGLAHCDGMDGPVVNAARKALDTGNVNQILLWVQSSDEPEIKKVFAEVVAVRKLGPKAQELADRHFFETVVRIHRAGEGASYTGLKPAGQDLGPVIPAADKAIEEGSSKHLSELLSRHVQSGVEQRFKAVLATKNRGADDVSAGREFVKAYVDFVHYVERLHIASSGPGAEDPGGHDAPKHEH